MGLKGKCVAPRGHRAWHLGFWATSRVARRHADRLSGLLGRQLTDAIVVTSDQLAELGYVVTGSVGQRRLGEIILIATGADFPVPDAGMAYEHGSMTAEEVLIPMAIWSAAQ